MARIGLVMGAVFTVGMLMALPFGCGGSASVSQCPGGPDCTCTGDTICACAEQGNCGFDCAAESCQFTCAAGGTCEGTCGKSCDAICAEGASCDLTLGEGSDFNCNDADCTLTVGAEADVHCDGGTCDVTCTGKCSVECTGGATCRIKCSGDSDYKPVEGTGTCGG